jgi:BASS family bile acid:Na+ symporter
MLADVAKFLLAHLVALLMLGIGLATSVHDLRDLSRRPFLYGKAAIVMWLAVPLLAIVAVGALDLGRIPAELVLIVAVCPGAPFIPNATKRKGEHHSVTGLDVLVAVSLLAPVLTPLWVAILDRLYDYGIGVSPSQVFVRVTTTTLVPLLVGLGIRELSPRIAKRLARPVRYVFLAALAVAVLAALYLGAPVLASVTPRIVLAVLVVVSGAAFLGYLAAWPHRQDQRTIGVAAALGNPGLALTVIAVSHPGFHAVGFVLAYVVLRKLALIPFEQWAKRGRHAAAIR